MAAPLYYPGSNEEFKKDNEDEAAFQARVKANSAKEDIMTRKLEHQVRRKRIAHIVLTEALPSISLITLGILVLTIAAYGLIYIIDRETQKEQTTFYANCSARGFTPAQCDFMYEQKQDSDTQAAASMAFTAGVAGAMAGSRVSSYGRR